MTPQELLAEADRLLGTVVPGTRGRWPRACAWLIRLALEQSLDEFWQRTLPDAAACSMRAQLLLLPRYAGEETAAHARDAWFGLAPAAHYHSYDLAPTAAELRRWLELVTSITAQLRASDGMPMSADSGRVGA
jgi:hypothetical protein